MGKSTGIKLSPPDSPIFSEGLSVSLLRKSKPSTPKPDESSEAETDAQESPADPMQPGIDRMEAWLQERAEKEMQDAKKK